MVTPRHKFSETPVSVEEAAKRLGISKAAAYNAVKSGELPSYRVGGSVRIFPSEIKKIMSKGVSGG